MYRIVDCPCCAAPITRTFPVVLAPFIRDRIHLKGSFSGRLSDCPECGFRCFVDRYDTDEVAAIYCGYRTEAYVRQRNRHEPWYTHSFNDAIGGSQEASRRNHRLAAFLRDAGILPSARSVLDWGGDRGQFIPDGFSERFVFDISGAHPIPGVIALPEEELGNRTFDLLLVCHVLEHASDPAALLKELSEVRASCLYVEVPFEPVKLVPAVLSTGLYERWVRACARGRLYPFVAFFSTAARVKFRALPPPGILQQHEHLNFFTEETLERLLERVGFRVIRSTVYRRSPRSGSPEAIGMLALPPVLPSTCRRSV